MGFFFSLINLFASLHFCLEDQRSLCEQLQLEELWDVLGQSLKQLEESNDQHAVLVLQVNITENFS